MRWFIKLLSVTLMLALPMGVMVRLGSHETEFAPTYYSIDLMNYYSDYSSIPVTGTLKHCTHTVNPSRFICRYDVQWKRWIIRGGCYIRSGSGWHCWVVIPENLYWRGQD